MHGKQHLIHQFLKAQAFNSHAPFIFLFLDPFKKILFLRFFPSVPHFAFSSIIRLWKLTFYQTLDSLTSTELFKIFIRLLILWQMAQRSAVLLWKIKTWGDEIVFPDSFCQGLWVGHGPGSWVLGIPTFTARDTGWFSRRILNSCYFSFLCVRCFISFWSRYLFVSVIILLFPSRQKFVFLSAPSSHCPTWYTLVSCYWLNSWEVLGLQTPAVDVQCLTQSLYSCLSFKCSSPFSQFQDAIRLC